jgi:hypothetical protein
LPNHKTTKRKRKQKGCSYGKDIRTA